MAAVPTFAAALIVEDIAATRDWLGRLVHEGFPGVGVVHAATLKEARAWLERCPVPDPLMLIDLGLPDGDGTDFIHEARQRFPDATLVVTTIYDDDDHLLAAMAAGAHGYILKDRTPGEVADMLARIAAGETALSPPVARRLLGHFQTHARFVTANRDAAAPVALTSREEDVLRLIGRGLTLPEAADVLAISAQTVATHVKSVYRKLGIGSRAEAALEAARRQLA